MGFKKQAAILAAALVTSGAMAATANADPGTIVGPPDLSTASSNFTDGGGVATNTALPNGDLVEVPANARVTGWHGNFECTDGCGEVRLVLLRHASGSTYDVIDASPWTAPSEPGIEAMPADLVAQAHDLLAFEGRDGGKVYITPATGGVVQYGMSIAGLTMSHTSTNPSAMALYNADITPLRPTETTLTGTPDPALVDAAITLTAHVSEPSGLNTQQSVDPTGTIAFTKGGTPIANCGAVALVGGTATCETTAPAYASTPSFEAAYSGDDVFVPSAGDTHVRVINVSTTTAAVTPGQVARLAPITYTADVAGAVPVGGEVHPLQVTYGTVAFSVDGVPVADCTDRPVNGDGVATCATLAPVVGGTHTLKADFSGTQYLSASTGSKNFEVLVPAVTLPGAVAFAPVTAGQASSRSVTLTNSGTANLTVSGASIKTAGAFAITADACSGKTLAPGATCDVQVTFSPAAAGPYGATLVFAEDSAEGTHSTALSGTGVAVPAPPTPPAPTATPTPTPQPGATLAPGTKTTLIASTPKSSNPTSATVSLPLSCPANEECNLNGTLVINSSSLSRSVRAAAADTTTVARFSGVHIAEGKLKTVKLKLSPAFVKAAQKRGIRRIKATLTINTVLGSGQTITTHQQVTVLLPVAAKRKAAAPKAQPKFTG